MSSVNPWAAIETLVTQRDPAAKVLRWARRKRTLKQAIDAFTINAARLSATGDSSGSIESGKRADLIVIDRDIWSRMVQAGAAERLFGCKPTIAACPNINGISGMCGLTAVVP